MPTAKATAGSEKQNDVSAQARKRLFQLFWNDRLRFIGLILTELISSSISIYYAFCSKNLIDAAFGGQYQALIQAALIYTAMILLRTGIRTVSDILANRMSYEMLISLRHHFLKIVESRSYSDISGWHSGIIMDRLFNDTGAVSDGLVYLLPDIIDKIYKLAAAFIVLLFFDKRLPALLAIAGVFVFIGAKFGGKRLKEAWSLTCDKRAARYAFYQEMLENLLVLKCFQGEKKVNSRALALENESYRSWNKWFNLDLFYSVIASLFFELGYLAAIVLCAIGIHAGNITFGSVTAILQLVTKVQSPVTGLSGKYPQVLNLVLSMERLLALENLPEEKQAPFSNLAELYAHMEEISGSDISFAYETVPILNHVSFSFRKGEFSLISGVSGEGKSTLIKLILGVYQQFSGKICLVTSEGEIALDAGTRHLFAYVPQGNQLLSGTVYESLTFLNEAECSPAEINNALRISCAADFIEKLPQGLQSRLGEDGLGLSEGQAQRIAIARAILSGAPILLLDEATSALDEQTESALLKNLRKLSGKTLLFVTHKKAAYDFCDVEWKIEEGKMTSRRLR